MDTRTKVQARPDVSPEQRAVHDLILRILKLRWIGRDDEADQMELALRRVDPAHTLVAGPFDTD